LAMKQPDQLATGTDGVAGRAPEGDPSSAGRPEAACTALGDPPGGLLQEALDLLCFQPRQVLEVLVTQQPRWTVSGAAARHAVLFDLPRESRAVHTQRLQPGPSALGRKRQSSTPARYGPGSDPWIHGSPEDVEGGLEKRELVLATDEAGSEAVTERGL